MSMILAVSHIVGAIIALSVWSICLLALASWETRRNQKAAFEEVSLVLGIPVGDLENDEHQEKLIKFAADKFSSELLRNRLSDLCGWIQVVWGGLGVIVQWGILVAVIWFTVTDDLSISVNAWFVLAIAIIFCVSSVIFGLLCKLLTGRFPGQARQARKMLVNAVRNLHAT